MSIEAVSAYRIAIIGATSAIAHHTAREFARDEHAAFFLVGRNAERLETIAADLQSFGSPHCVTQVTDFRDPASASAFPAQAAAALGGPLALVLVAHGSLTDEVRAAIDFVYADDEIDVNYASAVRFASAAARLLREQKSGQLAVITSVAGERGRASNAFYGATKAALIAFCSGLRARLAVDGLQLTELRPGVIATPMTSHLSPGFLTCPADRAGILCAHAIRRHKDVAYVPGFWRWIMFIIRALPEFVFKKLKF